VLTVTDDKGKPASDTVVVTIASPGPDTDDDGLSDNIEDLITGTDSSLADTDGDGILDGAEDFDFDGRSNRQEIRERTSPFDADIFLKRGLNLFAYPVEVPAGLTAVTFLAQLAQDEQVVSIGRLDVATQTIETVFAAASERGADFPIANDEGYFLTMAADAHLVFPGRPVCPTYALEPGVNLIGIPCTPPGFGQHDLLYALGNQPKIAAVEVLDLSTGRFRAAVRLADGPVGATESVHAGKGVLVNVNTATGPIQSPIAPPVVEITSPSDGGVTDVSPIRVIGIVDDPLATVSVNGIAAAVESDGTFTAIDVPLVMGPNTIEALAMGGVNLIGAGTISMTYTPPPAR